MSASPASQPANTKRKRKALESPSVVVNPFTKHEIWSRQTPNRQYDEVIMLDITWDDGSGEQSHQEQKKVKPTSGSLSSTLAAQPKLTQHDLILPSDRNSTQMLQRYLRSKWAQIFMWKTLWDLRKDHDGENKLLVVRYRGHFQTGPCLVPETGREHDFYAVSGTLTGPVGHPWQQAEDPSYALEEPNTSVDFYEEAGRNIRNYKADILLVLDSDASEEALHELEVAMATVDADVKLYKERYENNIGKCIEMHGEI